MIRAIIFDCFGVLALQNTWQKFIDSLPPDIDTEPIHLLNHQHDAGHLTREEYLYRLKDLTGHEPAQLEDLALSDTLKNHELLNYIKTLKQDYKIGLLSNIATDWVTSSFLSKQEQELFDTIVLSYQVGMTKPEPEIFRLVCQRLSVEPSEAIMVDDIAEYIAQARQTGMLGVVYSDMKTTRQTLDQLLTY